MKCYVLSAVLGLALWCGGTASAATICVGPQSGCFAQLQPAVAAARDGDTIAIARGTYAGGVTIDKSLRLQGAGATQTVINGGGPVLTIGRATDPTGQTVSIDGVTVTGGVNNSQPDHAVTFGGGIWIPTSQLSQPPFNGAGATVSISNSSITGNSVVSTEIIPPGFCGRPCGFNEGGGIDNGGVLTLTNVRITNNTAGGISVASDAGSGGIDNRFASTLVMHNCVVSGNHAVANNPIADSATAGGIGSEGLLDIEDSVISNNTVEYVGSQDFGDQFAAAGGLVVANEEFAPHAPGTIRNTQITGNRVSGVNTNPSSTPAAAAGGVASFGSATYDHVTVTDNSVAMKSAGYAGGDAGGMEVDAPVTVRDSVVARNSLSVEAPLGAIAFGGGITMFGATALTLERTVVVANSVSATSAPGPMPFGGVASALGGGIANGAAGIPAGVLTLTDSVVTANRLSGSAGLPLQGAGVYSTNGVVQARTVIAGNKPDNCFGC